MCTGDAEKGTQIGELGRSAQCGWEVDAKESSFTGEWSGGLVLSWRGKQGRKEGG